MRVLSRLNGWPMRSAVNASPMPSRASAHELGVDAVRYSFIVMDLHHLLLAGLPAHSVLPPATDMPVNGRFAPTAALRNLEIQLPLYTRKQTHLSNWTMSEKGPTAVIRLRHQRERAIRKEFPGQVPWQS